MMSWISLTIFRLLLCLCGSYCSGQPYADSLKSLLVSAKEDTLKSNVLLGLGNYYLERDPRAALSYGERAEALAGELNTKRRAGDIEFVIGGSYAMLGDYSHAFEHLDRSAEKYALVGDSDKIAFIDRCLSNVLLNVGDTALALEKSLANLKYQKSHSAAQDLAKAIRGVGNAFEGAGKNDEAMAYYQRALVMAK